MTASIEEYLVMGLMQLQGHLNAGPSTDPNTRAMIHALLDETRSKDLVVDAAANANATAAHLETYEYESEIQELGIVPDGALVCHVNNYVTVTFEVEDGAGSGKVSRGTIATTAANWAAGVPVTATLTSNTTIPAGGVLSVKSVKTGDGVAQPVRRAYARTRRSKA